MFSQLSLSISLFRMSGYSSHIFIQNCRFDFFFYSTSRVAAVGTNCASTRYPPKKKEIVVGEDRGGK